MTHRIPFAAIAFAVLSPIGVVASAAPVAAQPLMPIDAPFTATLSNATPLVFGMPADAAAQALGVPLTYLKGRPGDEIYLAIRDIGGSGLFPRKDRLFLQFRKGRLTGWKGDWGQNWMWE
ncbi:hypothetical protein [Tardiphaga sp.]|jgi:hypothetical protein|uniref:hypothetical protein n=1 Tax=Tardiphaga sp. TaxID=1926292 RepID=UPI0037D9CDA2